MSKMQLYLAGPDVFRPDISKWKSKVMQACAQYGLEPLLPSDNECHHPLEIVEANLALIRQAGGIIANLNPFRGIEPDSGTAFEVGYAIALGKPVIAYISSPETVLERVCRQYSRATAGEGLFRWRDKDGNAIEDAGWPVNLMLACTASEIVYGNIEQAIAAMAENMR